MKSYFSSRDGINAKPAVDDQNQDNSVLNFSEDEGVRDEEPGPAEDQRLENEYQQKC